MARKAMQVDLDHYLIFGGTLTLEEQAMLFIVKGLIIQHGEPLVADHRHIGAIGRVGAAKTRRLLSQLAARGLVDERDGCLSLGAESERFFFPEPRRLPRDEWEPLRRKVFRRDEETCVYCGASGDGVDLECDHVVPVSRGGSNDMDNLATACRSCNRSKKDLLLEEWRPERMH